MGFGFAIIGYLFLGGAGAAAFFHAACANLWAAIRRTDRSASLAETLDAGFVLALFVLAAGIVLLLMDVGNPSRVWRILLDPFGSVLGAGALMLALLFLLSAAFLLYQLASRRHRPALNALFYATGIPLACGTMAYTGFMLSQSLAYDVWMTPWLVVLFVASSLSCGLAAILAMRALQGVFARKSAVDSGKRDAWSLSGLFGVLELAALAVFLADRFSFGGTADDSVLMMLSGNLSGVFWVFVVGFGFAIPMAAHVAELRARSNRFTAPAVLAASSAVLVGGLALRYIAVMAGIWSPTVI